MRLSDLKHILTTLDSVDFRLENGTVIPQHFHVTEVGIITKHFIDCGGTIRNEKVANFQLWDSNDYDHRLKPAKLLDIIKLSEEALNIEDMEIEVEYQSNTIGRYDLGFDNNAFILHSKRTACLASASCGTPKEKKLSLSELKLNECKPDNGCC